MIELTSQCERCSGEGCYECVDGAVPGDDVLEFVCTEFPGMYRSAASAVLVLAYRFYQSIPV